VERGRRHRAGAGGIAALRITRRKRSRRGEGFARREQALLLLTGSALTERGLALAAQIAGKTGCKVMGQTYNPRMARGRGRFSIDGFLM